jgi:hypothetical protein
MRKSLSLLFMLSVSLFSVAQQVKLEQLKSWKPRNIGPAGMSGRITTIDAVVADPNISAKLANAPTSRPGIPPPLIYGAPNSTTCSWSAQLQQRQSN